MRGRLAVASRSTPIYDGQDLGTMNRVDREMDKGQLQESTELIGKANETSDQPDNEPPSQMNTISDITSTIALVTETSS